LSRATWAATAAAWNGLQSLRRSEPGERLVAVSLPATARRLVNRLNTFIAMDLQPAACSGNTVNAKGFGDFNRVCWLYRFQADTASACRYTGFAVG
jgi:hypothetical protein